MAKAADPATDEAWPPPPHMNADLLGQESAENELLEAFHGGTFAHAWLISGAKGIGKATLAHRFARYILSQGDTDAFGGNGAGLFGAADAPPDSLYVAPDSAVFRRVAAGGHADFLSVERTVNDKGRLRTEIVVDDVRRVPAFFSHTSGEGGWRVVVVDSADEMNRNAANALLKVLEEPPDRSVLLLVSHNPGRLLPTIRSRCRNLALPSLANEVMKKLLKRYLSDLPDDQAGILSRLAAGSIGDAVKLWESGGVELYNATLELLASAPDLDVEAVHRFADELTVRSKDPQAFATAMELLKGVLLRLTRYAAHSGAASMDIDSREDEVIRAIAPMATLDRWLEVWENVGELIERADAVNLEHKQVVLNVFSEIGGAVRQ